MQGSMFVALITSPPKYPFSYELWLPGFYNTQFKVLYKPHTIYDQQNSTTSIPKQTNNIF